MNNNEKILALQLILEDIRGNWGWGLEDRVYEALQLSEELEKEYEEFKKMTETINEFKEDMESNYEYIDGRFFRDSFPYGYEEMYKLHGMKHTYKDKSDEFKKIVDCLTYPEYSFIDWELK